MKKKDKRLHRKKRIRAKVFGTKQKPRLSVYRSNRQIFAQLVDDDGKSTIVSFSSLALKKKDVEKKTKSERAEIVGKELARLAKIKKIKKVVFDRGGYQYHGRVKSVAEGARKGGLEF